MFSSETNSRGHRRDEFPGFERDSHFIERKPGVELSLDPAGLLGGVQGPAGRASSPTHISDLGRGQEAQLEPSAHRGLVDAGRRGDLLCGGPGEGGRHRRSVGQESAALGLV